MTSPQHQDLQSCFNHIARSITQCQGNDSQNLNQALENMDTLAIIAADSDRSGFQDTCLLVQDKFHQIVRQNGKLDERQLAQLKKWTQLAADYLQQSNTDTADALTGFFTISELYDDLNNEDLIVLKELLEKECVLDDANLIEQEDNVNDIPFPVIDLSRPRQAIYELARRVSGENKPGFMYACLLFTQQLEKIQTSGSRISIKQLKLINDWIINSLEYLSFTDADNPANTLKELLAAKSWPAEIDNHTLEVLGKLSEIDRYPVLPSTLPEKLQKTIRSLTSEYSTYRQNFKESLVLIAQQIESLGDVAAELGYIGFQDFCLIVAEDMQAQAQHDLDQSGINYIHIIEWLIPAVNYFLNHKDNIQIEELLSYASQCRASISVGEEDMSILRKMLQDDRKNISEEKHLDNVIGSEDETVVLERYQSGDDEADGMIDTSDTLASPHTVSIELIEMLRDEMELIKLEIIEPSMATMNYNNAAGNDEYYSSLMLRMERFADACQAAELDGLSQACTLLAENLKLIVSNNMQLNQASNQHIGRFPEIISIYLIQPGSPEASAELITMLKHSDFPKPLLDGVAPALCNLLEAVHIVEEDDEPQPCIHSASTDDISISLPDDINQELLDGLLFELPKQTQSLGKLMQAILDGNADLECIYQAQRIAHTIKGSSNTVGVKGIANIAHIMEDIFMELVKHSRLPGKNLSQTLIDAADSLEEMTEALGNKEQAPSHSLVVLQQLVSYVNRIRQDGIDGILSDVDIQISNADDNLPESLTGDEEEDNGQGKETILHVPASLLDKALRLMGESMIINAQVSEHINQAENDTDDLVLHQHKFQELASDLEKQVELNHWSGTNYSSSSNTDFDALELEEYNELHSLTNRIAESSTDSLEFNTELSNRFGDIKELLHEKDILQKDIQDIILRARMVPVSTITSRLQRIARQAGRATGKSVTFNVIGADTLIDSDILNALISPLMHIIRNAIDHGIESPEARKTIGKTEQGKIEISFQRAGRQIVVNCKDDGAGLNREKIISRAKKSGLIHDNNDISETELYRLILNPGFSTSDAVTQTSGRGIGMDVVNNEIQRIKGNINIYTESGAGCQIEITAPLTLSTVHAILIKEQDNIIAISNHAVEQILHPDDFNITYDEGSSTALLDGDELPFHPVESLLGSINQNDINSLCQQQRIGLLVNADNSKQIISVDKIIDTRDLFVKSMGNYLNDINGVLGATILGSGEVVPVIDIPDLIRNRTLGNETAFDLTITDIHETLPTVLVVDDSLSTRRALSQIISDAGYVVLTAKDGLEALEVAQQAKPDIFLVDMEMPRMNGIELASHIRGTNDMKALPIIMITSRTTEKHKALALSAGVDIFMNKPFSEDQLLDDVASLIN